MGPVYYDHLSRKVIDIYTNGKQPIFFIAEEEKIFATRMAQKIFRFCEQKQYQEPRIYYFRGALGLNQAVLDQICVEDQEEIVSILDFKMDRTFDTSKVSRLYPDQVDVKGIRVEDLSLPTRLPNEMLLNKVFF